MDVSALSSAASAHSRERAARKVAGASLIGTLIEYYDFSVYGMAASLVLGHLFFPPGDPTFATLAAFATFAVAFLARPIGVVIFGTLGDRIGRRKTLVACLILMGLTTVAVGLLPTYAQAGVTAPILLVVCRLLQGVGLGGEWGGAVLLATEHAPTHRRAVYGAIPQLGPPLGFVLGSLVFVGLNAILTADAFLAWGWRVPFLLSLAMVAVGLWIRTQVEESPVFAETARTGRRVALPIVTVFRRYPSRLLVGIAATLSGSAIWYLITVFCVSYGIEAQGMTRVDMMLVACATAATHMVLVIPTALLAERVGRRLPMLIGAGGLAVVSIPMFALLGTGNPLLIGAGFCVAMVPFTFIYAPVAPYLAELYPTSVRYSGASAAFALSAILGGGIAPMVATVLVANGHSPARLGIYTLALSLISLACLWAGPETKGTSLTAQP